MGLFDKLFTKKICDFCGGEIGLLGNRKLEDGNMCKHCAAKLSPWFEDRRTSTIAEIQEQLEYRETNKEKVAAFHLTRTLGQRTKVLLDEDAGVFMVTDEDDLAEANPDVMAFSDVTGCELEIDENRWEKKKTDKDGKQVSYHPPRYNHSYNFHINIHVRNPYFDEIRFPLNSFSVEIEETAGWRGDCGFDPRRDAEYCRYKEMGEEIRDALMQNRQLAREETTAAATPNTTVTCPYCGAKTTPDASGCCEYCGGTVNN